MAELIDKVALYDAMTEEYKKHYAGTGKGYDFTIAMHMVADTPATTESEIRAKAIEEFAKALLTNEVVDKSVVRRVAEQLKEE